MNLFFKKTAPGKRRFLTWGVNARLRSAFLLAEWQVVPVFVGDALGHAVLSADILLAPINGLLTARHAGIGIRNSGNCACKNKCSYEYVFHAIYSFLTIKIPLGNSMQLEDEYVNDASG